MIKRKETAMKNIANGDPKIRQWSDELRQDRELCLEAVKQHGYALNYVPEELRNRELCLEAVKQHGWAICCVPEKLRDRELYLEAVKQNGEVLWDVPGVLLDHDMCAEAVRQNGRAIGAVPKELVTRDLCHEAAPAIKDALDETLPLVPKEVIIDALGKSCEDELKAHPAKKQYLIITSTTENNEITVERGCAENIGSICEKELCRYKGCRLYDEDGNPINAEEMSSEEFLQMVLSGKINPIEGNITEHGHSMSTPEAAFKYWDADMDVFDRFSIKIIEMPEV